MNTMIKCESYTRTRRIRDGGPRIRDVLGAIACLLLVTPSLAAAKAVPCSRAIASAGVVFTQKTLNASQRCEDNVLRGKLAGPCPDPKTVVKLAKIHAKLDASIRRKCGGRDRVCGVGGDDDSLATIGWNIGQCPTIVGGAQCSNTIADCTDLADCLDCVEGTITDDAITLAFGAFTVGSPATPVGKCQHEIGKQWSSFLAHRTRSLQRCEDGLLRGKIGGPCPDLKTARALAKLERNLERSLCRKCGGADKLCGGVDDLTLAAIGFAANCPNVTIPAGASCGGAITTLTELVACLECVGQFDSECLTRLASPAVVSYPAECSGPTPSPASTATPTATTTGVTATPTRTATRTATVTATPTLTATSAATPTPTATSTPLAAPPLGAAAPFGGFGGSATLTNDGLATVINGDIGVNAASTKVTGLRDSGGNVYTVTTSNDGMVNGLIYTLTAPPGSVPGATVTQAHSDALDAFNSLSPASLPGGIDMSSLAQCPSCGGAGGGPDELAGRTLPPGVYLSTTGTYDIGGVGRTTWVQPVVATCSLRPF